MYPKRSTNKVTLCQIITISNIIVNILYQTAYIYISHTTALNYVMTSKFNLLHCFFIDQLTKFKSYISRWNFRRLIYDLLFIANFCLLSTASSADDYISSNLDTSNSNCPRSRRTIWFIALNLLKNSVLLKKEDDNRCCFPNISVNTSLFT